MYNAGVLRLLRIVSVLLLVATPLFSQEEAIRVHVLPLVPSEEPKALESLLEEIAHSTVLTLGRRRGFDITELEPNAATDGPEYLSGLDLGTLDRLITVALRRAEGGFQLTTRVYDPREGVLLNERVETVPRVLELFRAADLALEALGSQIATRRIALGRLRVELSSWVPGELEDVQWDSLELLYAPDLVEAITDWDEPVERADVNLSLSDTTETVELGETVDLLEGSRRLTVEQQRGTVTEPLFDEVVQVREGETTEVIVSLPRVSERERAQVAELIRSISESRQRAGESRSDEHLQAWVDSYSALVDYLDSMGRFEMPLGEAVAYVAAAQVAAKAERVRLSAEARWREPDPAWIDELAAIAAEAESATAALPETTVAELRISERTVGLQEEVVKLLELQVLRDVSRSDWFDMEERFDGLMGTVEERPVETPTWLERDAAAVEELFDRFREEDSERHALYGAMTLGGAGVLSTGVALYTAGVLTALRTERDRDERDYSYVAGVPSGFSAAQSESGGMLRLTGVGSMVVGLTSFLGGHIIQSWDVATRSRRLLRARLSAYFDPRRETNRDLERSEEADGIELPITAFSEELPPIESE